MSSPLSSLAVIPARPVTERYGVGALHLFGSFNRVDYQVRFGVQPPPFDPYQPVRRWFDTDPDPGLKQYSVFEDGKFQTITLPLGERVRPNLPGLYEYERLSFEPTGAMQLFPDGRREPLSPSRLTTPDEAENLCGDVDGSYVSIDDKPSFPFYFPANETRRIHIIHFDDGSQTFAWYLRQLQATRGVGHPGYWDTGDMSNIRWIVDDQPQPTADYSVIGVPCRSLYDDEEVVKVFGGMWQVLKVEKPEITLSAVVNMVTALEADLSEAEFQITGLTKDVIALLDRVSKLELDTE